MDKKIISNASALYIRLAVSSIVGIYTSRIILDALGFSDYGIYNLVGGVVVMASFFNASMTGATTRFITFDLENCNLQSQRETFTAALSAHLIIAGIVLVFAETVGLWFVYTQLDIPTNRISAVNWVYQVSVLCMLVSITQVPYNASILAHEKMNIYAYIEILNSFLKLGIAYLLYLIKGDKLIIYSVFVFGVSTMIALLYRLYCIRNFESSRLCGNINKEKLRKMLSFSGYDLYGNVCVVVGNQFVNIVINQFFGVILNAASGIANSINGIISQFSSNIVQAFRPQIIKQYAKGNILEMEVLISQAIRFSVLMMSCLSIPLLFEMDYVMSMWLKDVPNYASSFCKIMLIGNMLRVINNIFLIGIHATGNIKVLSFGSGTIYLLQIPLMYLLLKFQVNPLIPYIFTILNLLVISFIDFIILKHNIPQISIRRVLTSLLKVVFLICISTVLCYYVNISLDSGIFRVVTTTFTYVISAILFTLFLLLSRHEREKCIQVVKQKFRRYGV